MVSPEKGKKNRHCEEGFFSRRSNLTTIASSERFKIASCLAMTNIFR